MLLTFAIEVFMALYAIAKMPKTKPIVLGILLLILLATFQLSEYAICEGMFWSGDTWGRIGFVAITALPAIGFHLARSLTGKSLGLIGYTAYLSSAVWMAIFASGAAMDSYQCTSNYLIFRMNADYGGWYFVFYYVWLIAAMLTSFMHWQYSKSKSKAKASLWLLAGYASFVIPATIIWALDGPASRGLPSVMCGFAVILAVILTLKVMPLSVRFTPKARKTTRKPVK